MDWEWRTNRMDWEWRNNRMNWEWRTNRMDSAKSHSYSAWFVFVEFGHAGCRTIKPTNTRWPRIKFSRYFCQCSSGHFKKKMLSLCPSNCRNVCKMWAYSGDCNQHIKFVGCFVYHTLMFYWFHFLSLYVWLYVLCASV